MGICPFQYLIAQAYWTFAYIFGNMRPLTGFSPNVLLLLHTLYFWNFISHWQTGIYPFCKSLSTYLVGIVIFVNRRNKNKHGLDRYHHFVLLQLFEKKTQFVDCKMVVAVARAFTDYLDQILQSFFAKIVFFLFSKQEICT